MKSLRKVFEVPAVLTLIHYRVVLILVATVLLSVSFVPGLTEFRTLSLSLDRAATLGLVAVGLTVVLLLGKLDLSVGSILALSGIAAIALQPQLGQFGAAAAGVLVGLLAGILNGFLVVVLQINSLVATLASMIFLRALCHFLTDSNPISGNDPLFGLAVSRALGGSFSLRTFIFLLAIILLFLWLTYTVSGRHTYAVGSNEDAATASGIRSGAYVFGAFVFSGLMSGIAGVMQSLATNTGSPVFGSTIALTAIAAVVIGGTRLEGGRGSALGTLGGVLVLAAITTTLEYESVASYYQNIVTGTILLILILLDRIASDSPRSALSLSSLLPTRAQKRSPAP
ncbi:ABC transporter permease [Nesterenkonia haasae]|uniref:ABC transporter permease n=1 Tax=Nesterenkonia haasae TaxID=2587813 RepID=UPI001291606D|nr:ABC transporter permease [Nesterenkonia haasae]NDK31842.1 ABC transporter permease [Nesterenkonia haasae]